MPGGEPARNGGSSSTTSTSPGPSVPGYSATAAAGRSSAAGGSPADEVPAQDCLGCRVTGCLFGLGGAAYLGSTLLAEPPPRGVHRYSVIAAAGTMFVFGMYRAFG